MSFVSAAGLHAGGGRGDCGGAAGRAGDALGHHPAGRRLAHARSLWTHR